MMISSQLRRLASVLFGALIFALTCAGSGSTAFAEPFGVGAITSVWNPNFCCGENSTDFYDAFNNLGYPSDRLVSGPLLLIPESLAYTSGTTAGTVALGRSPMNGSGFGSAGVNLATGKLKAFASASGEAVTYTVAGFSDTLTPLEDGLLSFVFTVNGSLLGSNSFAGAWFAINNSILMGIRGETNPDCFGGTTGFTSCTYGFDVPVSAGVPVRFIAAIDAGASNDSSADLSHTGSLGATGVAFTSASGVFLTEVDPGPQAIPEPATLTLIGLGLSGIGLVRRKSAVR